MNHSQIGAKVRDLGEGADVIMVKPSSAYLDIISDAKELARNVRSFLLMMHLNILFF